MSIRITREQALVENKLRLDGTHEALKRHKRRDALHVARREDLRRERQALLASGANDATLDGNGHRRQQAKSDHERHQADGVTLRERLASLQAAREQLLKLPPLGVIEAPDDGLAWTAREERRQLVAG